MGDQDWVSIAVHRTRGRHRLSALKAAKLNTPGLYEDGAGLRLVVTDRGTKRWVVRVTVAGRRVERGLGVWPTVGLEDARREAEDFRRAAREGRDARIEKRRAVLRNAITFQQAFFDFFAVRKQQLSTERYAKQWESTMRDYVFPRIGDLPVADITAREILDILRPIWFLSTPE